jgi:hypothetical protein
MLDGKAIRTWTIGATSGLVAGALIGGILAAATAQSSTPCTPTAQAGTQAHAVPTAIPAPKVASSHPTRWTERPTQYASGDHLWFSWRASMVRWLGGQPVPTMREASAANREGWWGETVNTPPSALAYATSDR